ncbi:NAD-dependent succinate-semialdehyde dehydrogenase [Candidatus Woesearchaeota archaeon]|nr:NAD-dependent succinate-semialdehyde dehydrogenase [Candidatus Woesearchaeota archaeon]
MKIKTINPATEEVLSEYDIMPKEMVFDIAKSARKAQKSWGGLPLKKREELMKRAAAVLRENKEEYAKLMTLEMGKPITESRGEIEKCAWTAEIYAGKAEEWLKDEQMEADGLKHLITYQPLGTVLAIMPWNFPFWQAFRFAIPTLLAGNAAILKHASNVTGSALKIEEVFRKAGFPENVFRTIIAEHSAVNELIGSDYVQAVSLTGSTEAGARIAEAAGRHIKKVVLELGGSDPFIVLEDADMDFAVENAVRGRMLNMGQSCISAKRFIVHESIADEFARKVAERFSKIIIGNPLDEKTQGGPLINKKAVEQINRQVQDSIKQGAKLLTGGKAIGSKGSFYEPTLLYNVRRDMKVACEEVFGPVGAVMPFKTAEEAVEIANSSEFGLGGSVFTKDLKKGEEIVRKIESGSVFVNSFTKSDPRMPFGGIKKSGIGRELSKLGIREFTNAKGISVYKHGK